MAANLLVSWRSGRDGKRCWTKPTIAVYRRLSGQLPGPSAHGSITLLVPKSEQIPQSRSLLESGEASIILGRPSLAASALRGWKPLFRDGLAPEYPDRWSSDTRRYGNLPTVRRLGPTFNSDSLAYTAFDILRESNRCALSLHVRGGKHNVDNEVWTDKLARDSSHKASRHTEI